LLPGETAYATIPTGDVSDTVKIPNAALRFAPSLPVSFLRQLYEQNHIPAAASTSHVGGWRVVWKPEPNGTIRPLAVRTGITDYTFTQLISGDVKSGDVLVTGEQGAGGPGAASPASPPRFGAPR